jgi:uncharacterized BrkB/YihY/UPF0761 family membrane protein
VALIVLVALSLVLVGPTLADKLGQTTGWGAPFEWTWLILQWPLVFALVYVSGIAILTGAELNAEIEHASPYGIDRFTSYET